MSYDVMGRKVLDYEVFTYDGSRLQFRGPRPDLNEPYVAFMGATETFGKFIQSPFPDLLRAQLPVDAVNLGLVNCGLDAYLNDPAVLEVARKAQLRVMQVMGAVNLSNRFYRVHPRRNDRFVAPSPCLTHLFPEVDFTEFSFTRAMLARLRRVSSERFALIQKELQDIWLARMTALMRLLGNDCVLLWFAENQAPLEADDPLKEPALIDKDLLDRVRAQASVFVEVVPPREVLAAERELMLYDILDRQAAQQVMSPAAHAAAARALQEPCRALLV